MKIRFATGSQNDDVKVKYLRRSLLWVTICRKNGMLFSYKGGTSALSPHSS